MSGEIVRRPQARLDLIEIWAFIAEDNEAAADRCLDLVRVLSGYLDISPEHFE